MFLEKKKKKECSHIQNQEQIIPQDKTTYPQNPNMAKNKFITIKYELYACLIEQVPRKKLPTH